jgi:hypothetical protein
MTSPAATAQPNLLPENEYSRTWPPPPPECFPARIRRSRSASRQTESHSGRISSAASAASNQGR